MPTTGDILTIRQLAEYLMVSEKTVYRMLDRHQLPAMRVGAQWRFRRQDIDAWVAEAVTATTSHTARPAILDALDETSEIAIHPLLAPENVWLAPRPRTRDELLAFMVANGALDGGVDRDHLLRAVREREALCSTALLENAAFPHPVDPRPFRFTRKRTLLAVTREPLDWADPHGHRPRIVAMILARSTQGHLLALSRAIKLFGDSALAARLISAPDAATAIASIRDAEARFAAPVEAGR
jgi:PTS system nitrogen regulatory IIA component